MSTDRGSTRQRMLLSAVTLLQQRGANGVTIDAVLAHSGAPRGSVYHHFPGGRDQMVLDATRLGADFIAGMIERAEQDPTKALDRFIDLWKEQLRDSDFESGCPVAAIAMDAQAQAEARDVAATAFKDWTTQLAGIFRDQGLSASSARTLASSAISAIEGAIILCQSQRSTKPLDDVRRMLSAYHDSLRPAAG